MTEPAPAPHLSSEVRSSVLRLARRLRQESADGDLGHSQLSTLARLFRDGPQSPNALSMAEHVSPPSMNRTLNGLESAGFVARARSDDDRRSVLVSVTDAGRDFVLETRHRRDAWLEPRLAALTAEERDLLARATTLIRRLTDQ